jgi:hypothetical protein
MQLLRLADVAASPDDRVFRYSRGRALVMVAAALATTVLSIAVGRQQHSVLLYYIAAVLVIGVIVLQTFVTARIRSSNWLVRANDEGLFVQFRSYLNYRFPADRQTVAFIPYSAVRSARAMRERRELPDPDSRRHPNSTTIQRATTVHLEVTGDTGPLARALDDESRLAVGESRGDGPRTRYRHVPVRMPSPGRLEIEWAVVPRADSLLALLSSHGVPTDTVDATQDYAHLETLDRNEQEKRLLELVEQGNTIAAIRIARQLYGWDLTRAKNFIDGLRGSSGPPTPNTLR